VPPSVGGRCSACGRSGRRPSSSSAERWAQAGLGDPIRNAELYRLTRCNRWTNLTKGREGAGFVCSTRSLVCAQAKLIDDTHYKQVDPSDQGHEGAGSFAGDTAVLPLSAQGLDAPGGEWAPAAIVGDPPGARYCPSPLMMHGFCMRNQITCGSIMSGYRNMRVLLISLGGGVGDVAGLVDLLVCSPNEGDAVIAMGVGTG
jgi:hypothetical protein